MSIETNHTSSNYDAAGLLAAALLNSVLALTYYYTALALPDEYSKYTDGFAFGFFNPSPGLLEICLLAIFPFGIFIILSIIYLSLVKSKDDISPLGLSCGGCVLNLLVWLLFALVFSYFSNPWISIICFSAGVSITIVLLLLPYFEVKNIGLVMLTQCIATACCISLWLYDQQVKTMELDLGVYFGLWQFLATLAFAPDILKGRLRYILIPWNLALVGISIYLLIHTKTS